MPLVLRRHGPVRAGRRGDGGRRRRRLPVLRARSERAARRGPPLVDYLAQKFGDRSRVQAAHARLTDAGVELGIDFRWSRMRRANTFDAHRLLAWALHTAGADAQRTLKKALLRAYFTDGRDVADHGVLADLAAEAGLDRARGRGAARVRRRGRLRPSRAGRGLRQRHQRRADLRRRGPVDAPGRPRHRQVGEGPRPDQAELAADGERPRRGQPPRRRGRCPRAPAASLFRRLLRWRPSRSSSTAEATAGRPSASASTTSTYCWSVTGSILRPGPRTGPAATARILPP